MELFYAFRALGGKSFSIQRRCWVFFLYSCVKQLWDAKLCIPSTRGNPGSVYVLRCVCVRLRLLLLLDKLAGMELVSKAWPVYLTALSGDSLWTRPFSLTDCCIMETKDSGCTCYQRVKLTNSSGSLGKCSEMLSVNADPKQATALSTVLQVGTIQVLNVEYQTRGDRKISSANSPKKHGILSSCWVA